MAAFRCLVLLATLLMAGAAQAETTFERARAQGFVTMGFTNELPFSYSDHGKLTGADAVVVAHVLERVGIKEVLGTLTEFQSLIPGLRARRFDMNSTMFITPARCKQIQFTAPLWAAIDGMIVPAGNPKKIDSYESVAANPALKVGVLAGSVRKAVLLKLGAKEEQVIDFPDQPSALAAVRAGRIDGFLNTGLGNQSLLDAARDPALERASPFRQPVVDGKLAIGFGGLGFRFEDKDFYEAFNKELVAFLGTPDHLALVRPFGMTAEEIRPALGKTAAELCRE